MVEVIPAILTNNPKEAIELIQKAEGITKKLQIDIVDGVFADNQTIEPQALETVDADLKLDFHLMVKEPKSWVEKCVRAHAERIIGQVELMTSQVDFVGEVQKAGVKVGLAIDLVTPVANLDQTILNNLDVVLVMSVPAGFGGQKFDRRALEKISKLDEIRARDKTPFRICDDGGITLEYIDDVQAAGADEVVIGARRFLNER